MTDDDLDQLADYVAGVLDDAEAARVALRIDTDPEWAGAYAVLSTGTPEVTSALAELADPPLPEDLAARFADAIAAERHPEPADRAPGLSGSTRGTTVVRLDRRRRWRGALTGSVAAVAVLVACLGGFWALRGMSGSRSQMSSTDSRNAGPAAGYGAPVARTEHSGTNYSASTLPSLFALAPATRSNGDGLAQGNNAAELDRLSGTAALQACLATVRSARDGTPTVVDYARFEGRPALIVWLNTGRIVVVGGDCGLPGVGEDEIYTTVP